ncbi:ATP synthase subunit delta', mitochondrial [Physcomitrium patens]|uniref:ATP synthase F1 complex delta/epsilon subunit N-terminal domain-containing protein n=1 Tax=Physcomitrium patens TaxID=3218 RepID=A9RFQ0_PHYPA|nr:ATP synthase subunit delta', mitochondrial-like [Physcomitrium patens]XP_024366708.1 ATP synthase subunit delta', mitochondrial-like [Physcomitrium patens]PNR27116.1 hypothetical protein PHYPA_030597 [Physcomitrium patens]|eukprot:XP_024366707.1 ATP synthase subunit delta', mitochondrial-like [Physcomitrella patens]
MLGRQGLRSGLRTWAACRPVLARSFADAAPAEAIVPESFKQDWKKVAPNYDLPHFPSEYMSARPPVATTLPTKLTVNFVLPHQFEMQAKEVDMVIVPATSGQMGVLPGHVPTIAELKPGLMSVHEGADVKQYFVSSGFAFVHANSVADIVAIEAVSLDKFDPEEVKKGVQEYTQKVANAKDDLERAEAQIGLEVHSALQAALGVSA